jgi:GNAT superfamily N-acetyltransferase
MGGHSVGTGDAFRVPAGQSNSRTYRKLDVSAMEPRVEFISDQFADIDAFLEDRISEFNAAATGFFDAEEYAAAIRDSNGRIIAAVSGFTWGGCCQIDKLWVDQSARRQRMGALLVQAVEEHALGKGCAQVILSSHTFQAPDFYRRLGYVEQARVTGYPMGHSDIHFKKLLTGR